MTPAELAAACRERRQWYAENGLTTEPGLQLTLPRMPGKGERMRVLPGVLGEVCCWNGKTTVVRVLVKDVERALAKAAPLAAEGKEKAPDPCATDHDWVRRGEGSAGNKYVCLRCGEQKP